MRMEKMIPLQKRAELARKLEQALEAEIQILSTEMRQILCDDLVTALESRLIVLAQAEP